MDETVAVVGFRLFGRELKHQRLSGGQHEHRIVLVKQFEAAVVTGGYFNHPARGPGDYAIRQRENHNERSQEAFDRMAQ